MNIEEELLELIKTVAKTSEQVLDTTEALRRHEEVCANRYGWILKIVLGSAATTIAGLGAVALMLLEKII